MNSAAGLEAIKSRMPPPLPCLIGLLLGLVLGWLWPWRIAPYPWAQALGVAALAGVAALGTAMSQAFRRHGTSPDPAHETTALVDSGPFRWSRNPAYLTAGLLQIALGCFFNNAWIVLLVLPALAAIHYLVVVREEAYLEAKFGQAYRDYRARVRPWL